jgi:dihydrofolate reductase
MPRLRVHNLNISTDGFAAGSHVSFDEPIGEAQALFAQFDGRFIHGIGGIEEPVTLDRAMTALWGQGIGAEIMGCGKFGPPVEQWPAEGWRGWWGDEPPFLTPCFVLTHHDLPSLEFANGTSFQFVDGSPTEVLDLAFEAAGGLDVRLGGGPSVVRQFLEADLVDFLHLVTVPITLEGQGGGTSLAPVLREAEPRFTVESVESPTGLVHHLWNRRVDRV